MQESLTKEINRSLSTLSATESDIIEYFFGLNGKTKMSLEEIAEQFGLTETNVSTSKEKALRRLKQTFRNKLLQGYLGE